MNATRFPMFVIQTQDVPTLKETIPVNVWKVILVMGNSTAQVRLHENVSIKLSENSANPTLYTC